MIEISEFSDYYGELHYGFEILEGDEGGIWDQIVAVLLGLA